MEVKVDRFKIYIGRLQRGETENLSERCAPECLGVSEKELRFDDDVLVEGNAYIAEDTLILHLNISAVAKMPCAICNEWTSVPIQIQGFYHTVPLTEVKSAVYDYQEPLREAVLLEVPPVVECNGGACPARNEIEAYLHASDQKDEYHPFKDL